MDNLLTQLAGLTAEQSQEDAKIQTSSSWQKLPTELVHMIAEQVFLPDTTGRDKLSAYPQDAGPPDLALMRVNGQCRDILDDIIPRSVLVEIRHHICFSCQTTLGDYSDVEANIDHFTRFFSQADSEPWTSLLNKASVVTIDVRCSKAGCGSQNVRYGYRTATLYLPKSTLTTLTLSQLIMIKPTFRDVKRIIDITCTPRSYKGARISVEFLKTLAKLIQGLKVGHMSTHNEDLYQLPKPLSEEMASAAKQMQRNVESWTDAALGHEAYLAGSQRLLDEGEIPMHQVGMIAMQAVACFGGIAGWREFPIPRPDPQSEMISDEQLREFMTAVIHTDCMIFLILHGLSGYLAIQMKQRCPSDHPELPSCRMPTYTSHMHFWKASEYNKIRELQTTGDFRPWKVEDLEFLIYQAAVSQCSIRFYTTILLSSFRSIWPYGNEHALSLRHATSLNDTLGLWGNTRPEQTRGEVRDRIAKYVNLLGDDLADLEHLDCQVNTLASTNRDITGDELLKLYAEYEVVSFIESTRSLLGVALRLFDQDTGVDETLRTMDTSGLMIPKRLRIPTVIDRESMLATFRDLNQSLLFRRSPF